MSLVWTREDTARSETWTTNTPFGVIRVCSNGVKAMCIAHPSHANCIGVEMESVDACKLNAEILYRDAIDNALRELK